MNLRIIAAVLFIPSMLACAQSGDRMVSEKFAPGRKLSQNADKALKEVSGIASSKINAGLMWVQNDSGNDPAIYLINRDMEIVLTCRLDGVQNRDWEDIAVGPAPVEGKTYVYVGDIGDNKASHPVKFIYRFEEPAYKPGKSEITISEIEKITFRLSDAMKDTESLLIDHKTKNLYVISKREEPVTVYEIRYPFNLGDTLSGKKIMTLPFAEIVSADVDARTGDILLKNYDKVFYWRNAHGEDVASLLKRQPVEVNYEREVQGEAITWAADGSGFYTVSEQKKKQQSWLYFYQAVK
jgi:hypothetical protein